MDIFESSDPAACRQEIEFCLKGKNELIVNTCAETAVATGEFNSMDNDICSDLGFPIVKLFYLGGSIVCFPGDLSMCEVKRGMSDFGPNVADKVTAWLKEKGLSVSQDKNDILVDGRKVVSWARARTIQGMCLTVVHFSIGMEIETVKLICTKPMKKIPGALSEYGISAGDVYSMLVSNSLIEV